MKVDQKDTDNNDDTDRNDKEENVEKLLQKVSTIVSGPSKLYEMARRKIHRDVNEFWFYIRSRLEQVSEHSKMTSRIEKFPLHDFIPRITELLNLYPEPSRGG